MNTLMIFAAVGALIFVAYAVIICLVIGRVPESLSQTVFYIRPSRSWVWTVCIFLSAFLVMPLLIERTPDSLRFLAFITCVGVMAVAVCPLSKEKHGMARTIHYAGAYTACIASQVMICASHFWILAAWAAFSVACLYMSRDGRRWQQMAFWAEMVCAASVGMYCIA